MNRLLVALLAAFDAVIVVAVGLAVALAPLTLLWVFGLGSDAAWGVLWAAAARLWQAGHLVPLDVRIDEAYAVDFGIPAEGTNFIFSLAPLAFAVFTAVFAARSGARTARAGAWIVGVTSGTVTVGALATLVALTAHVEAVGVELWTAIALPTAVFAVAALGGALVRAWREGDGGLLDRLRYRLDIDTGGVVEAGARGAAAATVGLIGVGAMVTAAGLIASAGDIVALYETAHVDLVGVIVVSLGQLAYLPTLIVWGAAYAAGPGFALGTGTSVSPGGTNLGVVPGVPVLGVIPESPSPWLLLLALLVVGVGAAAGAVARARLRTDAVGDAPITDRLVVLAVVGLGAAASAALLCVAASGAIGPGRLADIGPDAGVVALAVSAEVVVGAAAMLLAPSIARRDASRRDAGAWTDTDEPVAAGEQADAADTAPLADLEDPSRPPVD